MYVLPSKPAVLSKQHFRQELHNRQNCINDKSDIKNDKK